MIVKTHHGAPPPNTYRCPVIRRSCQNALGDDEEEIEEALRVVYLEWRSTDGAPKVDLLEVDVLAEFAQPIRAVGMFVADGHSKTGCLKLLHGFERHAGAVGKQDIDRKFNFCFEGEVDGTDVFTVPFDPNQLGMTAYVNATTTVARHLTLLEYEPTQQLVGPFESTAAGIHTIQTRSSMCVPYELVPVFHGKDYTATEAFQLAYPLLEGEGLKAVCAPFLTFLQLASTAPTTDNPQPITLQDKLGLPRRVTHPGVVRNRRESVLYRFLPDLRPSSATLPDAFVASISAGLTHIAAEMHADHRARDTRAVESARKKTFHDKYGERITDGILLLTGAVDDNLLPPFYQEPGGRQKGGSECVILQREVDQAPRPWG
jgi:hypothetical protein